MIGSVSLGSVGFGQTGTYRQPMHVSDPAWPRTAEVKPVSPAGQSGKVQEGTLSADRSAAASSGIGPSEMPYIPDGYGPEELATRTRLAYPELGRPDAGSDDSQEVEDPSEEEEADAAEEDEAVSEKKKTPAETAEEGECETCKKRKYQDGSDDPGVSFKNATRVDPKLAASAVRGHEMEHVIRERVKAQRENRKVISQTVTYHTGICPECGKFFVAGGTTRTVTASKPSNSQPVTGLQEASKLSA